MSADGMPHSPKPPAAMLAPDGMSATAVAGSRSTSPGSASMTPNSVQNRTGLCSRTKSISASPL
jgi:hypothetical protein